MRSLCKKTGIQNDARTHNYSVLAVLPSFDSAAMFLLGMMIPRHAKETIHGVNSDEGRTRDKQAAR